MELLQLKYFCHAAKSENFSATAKAFSVPASNISQTVKRLEKEIGTPLFNRNSNRITLNDRGKDFYQEIKKALNIIESAVSNANRGANATMKIGIFSNRRIVMSAIEKFQKRFDNISLVISHDRQKANEDFDLIVSDRLEDLPTLKAQKFFSEKMLLAANNQFFKGKTEITVDDIKQSPFVLMPKGSGLYDINQNICESLGFSPRIALQSDDPFYIRKCIELGLGICFVPEFSWQGQFSPNITLTEFGTYTRDVYLYQQASRKQLWYVKEFCNTLIAVYHDENNPKLSQNSV